MTEAGIKITNGHIEVINSKNPNKNPVAVINKNKFNINMRNEVDLRRNLYEGQPVTTPSAKIPKKLVNGVSWLKPKLTITAHTIKQNTDRMATTVSQIIWILENSAFIPQVLWAIVRFEKGF